MTRSPDRLFDLLPAVHRRRDAALGYPLRALLQVIAGQVEAVEDDIERLYENWFIETCEDWVVPYLGDLIGYRPVHPAGEPGEAAGRPGLARVLAPRAEVANTIRGRRRRGTAAQLELLARDVAGWPARAVEFYRLLAWTQALNHPHPDRGRTAALRDGDALDLLDGPFDSVAHSTDVRRLGSARTRGRNNLPAVGLFVWRLRAYPVTRSPAYCHESSGAGFYTFSVLGNDAPLFTRPAPEPAEEHIAGPLEVPTPIRRRALERGFSDYYGADRSFAVWVDGWAGHAAGAPLPPRAFIVADLSDWKYRTPRDHVAVDPVLGRLAFPPRQLPRNGVWVTWHYGFADDLGGGEYPRELAEPAGATLYRVRQEDPHGQGPPAGLADADEEFTRLGDALARWRDRRPRDAVVELADSGVYVEQVNLELPEGHTLQLRAAEGTRPVLRLMDWQTARPDALSVYGEPGSRFTLDGLLVAGRSVRCEGPLDEVTVRHCTLVPGWSLGPRCEPRRPAEPSLELVDTRARVAVEHTILGSIQVSQDEVATDPIPIRISDSILDATGSELEAVGAPTWPLAHAVLTVERSTVFGEVQAHAIELAENSIFMGKIRVARRQLGCMRFCYVTPGSRTPRRYRCQPDVVEQDARAAVPALEAGPPAEVRLHVEGEGARPGEDCPPEAAPANLEVGMQADDRAPMAGEVVTLSVELVNRGPRDAAGVEVTVTSWPPGLLSLPDGAGADVALDAEGSAVWQAGALEAGGGATQTVTVTASGDAGTVVATAAITAYTLAGDLHAIVHERVQRERLRVRPRFNSRRYGSPVYAQLAASCAGEISRGADDESELGAFHDLFQPQRAAALQARLEEFVPASADAAITFAS